MTTLAQVKRLAKRLGATVSADRTFDDQCLAIEAPHGKVWRSGPVHELCSSHPLHEKASMAGLWTDAIERMELGLDDCPDGAACEWCHPENDGAENAAAKD